MKYGTVGVCIIVISLGFLYMGVLAVQHGIEEAKQTEAYMNPSTETIEDNGEMIEVDSAGNIVRQWSDDPCSKPAGCVGETKKDAYGNDVYLNWETGEYIVSGTFKDVK